MQQRSNVRHASTRANLGHGFSRASLERVLARARVGNVFRGASVGHAFRRAGHGTAAAVVAFGILLASAATAARGDAQGSPAAGQAGAAQAADGRTTATWYFYKVKWGHQDEFLDLFQRNHYPLLQAQMEAGRFVSVRTYVPRYHGDGRADWTFAVELVARDGHAGGPSEQELIAKMYPDQATFRREERRRFELLEAHWDVPLTEVDMTTRQSTGGP